MKRNRGAEWILKATITRLTLDRCFVKGKVWGGSRQFKGVGDRVVEPGYQFIVQRGLFCIGFIGFSAPSLGVSILRRWLLALIICGLCIVTGVYSTYFTIRGPSPQKGIARLSRERCFIVFYNMFCAKGSLIIYSQWNQSLHPLTCNVCSHWCRVHVGVSKFIGALYNCRGRTGILESLSVEGNVLGVPIFGSIAIEGRTGRLALYARFYFSHRWWLGGISK